MIRRAPEWCPWCRGMADDAGARVTLLNPNRAAGGCVVTPWDGGGWECSTCGARAPRQAWAQAQRWQASSDVMRDRERQRANAAEAEVATSRALADALRADNERLRAIVAGRSDAPTPQEIDAHAATGGRWLLTLAPTVRDAAPVEGVVMRAGERWLPGVIVRWHRLGADGALLTPTVTP